MAEVLGAAVEQIGTTKAAANILGHFSLPLEPRLEASLGLAFMA